MEDMESKEYMLVHKVQTTIKMREEIKGNYLQLTGQNRVIAKPKGSLTRFNQSSRQGSFDNSNKHFRMLDQRSDGELSSSLVNDQQYGSVVDGSRSQL